MASKKVNRKSQDHSKAPKSPKADRATQAAKLSKTPKPAKAPKAPKAPEPAKALKAENGPVAMADDIREVGFHVAFDPESHERLEMLIALEVIARAGFSAPQSADSSRKKVELSDARKSALKSIAGQLKREIKYVRKFL